MASLVHNNNRKGIFHYLSSFTQLLPNNLPQGWLKKLKKKQAQNCQSPLKQSNSSKLVFALIQKHSYIVSTPKWKAIKSFTFSGWKNSSTTFCALESSEGEQASEGTAAKFESVVTAGLLEEAPCRFCGLR